MTITAREVEENWPLSKADAAAYAARTISSKAFYHTVLNAVVNKRQLSVVRMGDGERKLFIDCEVAISNFKSEYVVDSFDLPWRMRMGIEGLTYQQLLGLMQTAINGCEFYGPNVNGLLKPEFSLYPWYKVYGTGQPLVDNFFVNEWTLDQRSALLQAAGQVLVLHSNPVTATTFAKRARAYLDVGIRHIPISRWTQATDAVAACSLWTYPLVLVSAGPGSKWIIPEIAKQGKVVIDIGNAMDHWLLYELYQANPKAMDSQK